MEKKRRSPRRQQFYMVARVAIVSILVVAAALYIIMSRTLVKRAIEDSANNLSTIMKLQDSLLSQAERALNTISVDPDIAYFPKLREDRQYTKILSAYNSITRVQAENDFISNIAILYMDEDRVLATEWGMSDAEEYLYRHADRFFAEQPSRSTVLRAEPAQAGGAPGAIWMLRFLPLNYIARPRAVLSIGISGEFFQMLHQLVATHHGDFFLTSPEGALVYGSMDALPEDVGQVLAQAEGGGLPYYIIQGGNLISCVTSPYFGLTYALRAPLAAITADMNFLMYLIVGTVILMVLVSVSGATMVIRRWYKPLDTMTAEQGLVRLEPSEIAQKIRGIFEENEHLLSQNRNMHELLEQSRIVQRGQFLGELLHGHVEPDVVAFQLAGHGIHWRPEASFAVALLSIDDYSQYRSALSVMDRSMYELHLTSQAERMFSPLAQVEVVALNGQETACILAMEASSQDVEQQLFEAALALNGQLVAQTGVSVSLGLSQCLLGIQSLATCLRQAEKARDERWMAGLGQAYRYRSESHGHQPPTYPYDVEQDILRALKANKRGEALALLGTFYDIIMGSPGTDVNMVQHYFLQLLSATYRCLFESFGAYFTSFPPEKEMYGECLAAQSAQKLYDKLRGFYDFLFEQLEPAHAERYMLLAKRVQQYIDTHYAEDLSVEGLGDTFGLSASHLRRIYKERTGESLKTYLDAVRIEKACALLLSGNMALADIAEAVGFVSLQTFMRVFKKLKDTTPGEYRKECAARQA